MIRECEPIPRYCAHPKCGARLAQMNKERFCYRCTPSYQREAISKCALQLFCENKYLEPFKAHKKELSRQHNRQKELIKRGLCRQCGKRRLVNKIMCKECRKICNLNQKERYRKALK